jgi:hypothetical protein|tara:strand:- start:288 stop:425 length:138 start_codon:yes stop_codon:yes gene_type:complete
MDKVTRAKIIAIVEEHVKIPEGMQDRVCEALYKAYVEVREEMKTS